MSFTYNNQTNEYEASGTATMNQFKAAWDEDNPAPIRVLEGANFNFSDKDRVYVLTKVIIEDKGKFHANFLTIINKDGPTIENNGNCEIGCSSDAKGIINSGIMVVSNTRIENVKNKKYLELKNKSIGYDISNESKSCIKSAGSILIDSKAAKDVKIWIGNSICLGCEGKFEQDPYGDRNHPSLANASGNNLTVEQLLFTEVAYFIADTDHKTSKPAKNAALRRIENLISSTPNIRLSKVLAGRLLLYGNLSSAINNTVKTMSINGYGLTYPK